MSPAFVHHAVVKAFKGSMNLESLHPGQYLKLMSASFNG
jgi:hypothetical protein